MRQRQRKRNGRSAAGGGAAAPVTRLQASFTAANGTLVPAYTPEVGPAGVEQQGGGSIQSNRLEDTTGNGIRFTWDCSVADGTYSGVINRAGNGNTGLIFRFTNDNNFWMATTGPNVLKIFERVAGVYTERASVACTAAATVDHTITVTLAGDSITAAVGVASVGYTSSAHQTATLFGVRAADLADKFDDLLMTG